jgi:hypothetical protein
MMKKLLVICGMCMLLLISSTTVWGARLGDESYFADDFENKTNWESIALTSPYWGSWNGSGVTVSEDGKPGSNKCAVVNSFWGSSLDVIPQQTLTGTVGISFDMQLNKRSVDGIYLRNYLERQDDPAQWKGSQSGEWLLKFEWREENGVAKYDFKAADSTHVYTAEEGKWFHVKMILDIPTNRYSVWLTDEDGKTSNIIASKTASLKNGTTGGFNGLIFYYTDYGNWGVQEEKIGDFKLDNFDMYKEAVSEYEDFENASSFGDSQRQWWIYQNAAPLTIESEGEAENENNFLQIKLPYSIELINEIPVPQRDKLLIEFRVKTDGATTYLRMRGGDYPTILQFSSANDTHDQVTPTAPVSGETVQYLKNEWVKIKIAIDGKANRWTCSLTPETSGQEQIVFDADLCNIGALEGVQFGYNSSSEATAKPFCIDDFRVTAPAYQVSAAVTAADGTPITTKANLLAAKDASPKANVKTAGVFSGAMPPSYMVCALYQDGRLLSTDLNKTFTMEGNGQAVTTAADLDFSGLNAEGGNIEVKAFLWQGDNMIPLTQAGSVVFE